MSPVGGDGAAPAPTRSPNRSPILVAGITILAALAVAAVLGPLLAPHDPRALTGDAVEPPSARHLLGTNDIGQDIFSELLTGTRSTLAVAVPAATLAVAVAILVGVGAGLRGRRASAVTMRVVDGFLALPSLPLIVLLAALAGPNRTTIVLVIALAGWPPLARILHGETLKLRHRGFVRAAGGFGASPRYVMRRHLVPALGPVAAAGFVQWAAAAVGLEAGLALLGLGDPTAVSWGGMLNRALEYQGLYYSNLWIWWVLPAGLAITLAALGFTFVGVGLEPIFNRRWQRS